MALNIKNKVAEKQARKLSDLTGESLTVAVTEAIRERLERVQAAKRAGLAERLLSIGKDCAAHLKEPISSDDEADLYDEQGLPQ